VRDPRFGIERYRRVSASLTAWLRTARIPGAPSRSFWRDLTPVQLFVGSFLLLILFGTVVLASTPAFYVDQRLGWLDALFTATSAVCVTGLIVRDTATHFTPLGQAFLLLLIQLGGLGMITFASVLILGVGGRLSLRQEQLATVSDVAPHVDFRQLTRNIIRFTLLFELAGAFVLWLAWGGRLGWNRAIGHAVFHSISAFCNAGFSTFSDSLMSFQRDPVTLIVISMLVVAGGLGFLTLQELEQVRREARRVARRLSIHSRLALSVSLALVLTGWIGFTFFEWQNTLADLPAWARVLNGFFMSITARTAGFNATDYAAATEAMAFLTILLMFVGGSPGGTAGGVKTTTFALVLLLAWARLRGRDQVSVWGRTVPEETVHRAVGLFVAAFCIVTVAILVFTAVGLPAGALPRDDFLARMFEAVSAFGTVGLSMGVTDDLTATGRWLGALLMFLGRVGPLALASAIALPEQRGRFRYAHEDVIVG
jgi:trk system potassium uptake protein TrkH